MPRFSIIVPAYNAQATLSETLDAIVAQTLPDWECIVVDDGSTDDTLSLARSFSESNPRIVVVSQPNQGTAGAYNTGVARAVGAFVVICSADDLLLPEHLTRMSEFINDESEYDIYSTNGYFWKMDGSKELVYGPDERGTVMSLTLSDVISDCFYSVGAAYRRELFERVGGYRVGVFGEDYDFWLRTMAGGARHRYSPEALSLHRVSPAQKSACHENAYRSDIRLLTDLLQTGQLTREERALAKERIEYRKRLIADPTAKPLPPKRSFRERLVGFTARMLGAQNMQRLSRLRRGSAPR